MLVGTEGLADGVTKVMDSGFKAIVLWVLAEFADKCSASVDGGLVERANVVVPVFDSVVLFGRCQNVFTYRTDSERHLGKDGG